MSELENKDKGPVPTKIWVSSKKTINTGNYESAAFEAGMEVEVPPGSNIPQTFERAYKSCQQEIIKAAMKAGVMPE